MITKILFIKFGSFSNINRNVYKILEQQFSDHEIEEIDVKKILKHQIPKYVYFINLFFFFKEYAPEIIRGHKKSRECLNWFFATSYISIQVSKEIQKACNGKHYAFTFQTQSLYNGKIKNTPHFVYTDHTTKTNLLYPDINPHQYMMSKRFIEKSEKNIYADATRIFTLGSLPAFSLVTDYQVPKEKVVTIYAGSNAAHNLTFNSEKPFTKNILFVGVNWQRKGGPLLLKIFEKVLSKHPDASLTIVGSNPQNISLPNCKITGKIPIEKVSEYYKDADIFCLPTMREPFGIAFIEAMNFRLPIVANNIGCIPDLVKNDYNGYLIDNNIEDYANAICHLFDNPAKCRELGENGYEMVRCQFTWDVVGGLIKENIMECSHSLVSEANRNSGLKFVSSINHEIV